MRKCASCTIVIRSHAWIVDNRDFCGKECYCDFLGHRHSPKKRFCDQCRGPQIFDIEKKPQHEVIRSRKKIAKQQKSHARRRTMKLGG